MGMCGDMLPHVTLHFGGFKSQKVANDPPFDKGDSKVALEKLRMA